MSEVEDVFVGEEAELPKKVKWDVRPTKEEVELFNEQKAKASEDTLNYTLAVSGCTAEQP